MEKFEPICNGFTKFERKFVCFKRHLLDDFLKAHAKFMHKYGIMQKYDGDVKYRKYVLPAGNRYTKHMKTSSSGEKKEVLINEITEEEFDTVSDINSIVKLRKAYRLDMEQETILDIDEYGNNIILIEIWSKDEMGDIQSILPKGMYEVTGNPFYGNHYIACHKDNILIRGLYVIEGTDLIGKTTVAKKLADMGYVCMDRDQYHFSNHVDLQKPVKDSITGISANFRKLNPCRIIVLVTSNGSILEERLALREETGCVSEYDRQCREYNDLYIKIAEGLQKALGHVTVVDVYGKTPDRIVKEILERA